MANNLPPWHMWGNSQTVDVTGTGISIFDQTTQLVRIAYGRPESWHFMLATTINSAQHPSGIMESLRVDWELTTGIGRSNLTIPRFATHQLGWGSLGGDLVPGVTKYSYVTRAPITDDFASTISPELIDTIIAQDIQLRATIGLATTTSSSTANVTVTAFFAPVSHIRPEWFVNQFRGGENHGQ